MRKDVEQALSKFDINTFGNRTNIDNAEKMLSDEEKVLFVTPTNLTVSSVNIRKKDTTPGVLFLTDKRVLFCSQILGKFKTESVPLNEIRSINGNGNGLSGGHIEIQTIAKTYDILVSYKMSNVQQIQQIFDQARAGFGSQQAASPQPDILSQIEKLSSLKDKGIISESEFNAKKAELLSRL